MTAFRFTVPLILFTAACSPAYICPRAKGDKGGRF